MEEELENLRRQLATARTVAALAMRLVNIQAELEELCRCAAEPDVRGALLELHHAADFDAIAADVGHRAHELLHTAVHAIHAPPPAAAPRRARCQAPKCRRQPTPKCKSGMCTECCSKSHDQSVCRFLPTAGKRPRVPPPPADS